MSGADLFVDGFPHGTPAGYEQGCRGGACPAKVETGQSCREANVRASSDYGYRRLVQSGASAEVLAQPEVPVVAAPAPKMKPRARRGSDLLMAPLGQHKPKAPAPVPAPPVVEPEPPVVAPVPEPKTPSAAPSLHGTPQGYRKGCRDNCPGGPDGRTCREAISDYQRDRKAARAAEAATAPAAPAAEPPAPVEVEPEISEAATVPDDIGLPDVEDEAPADVDEVPVTSQAPAPGLDFHAIANALEAFSFAFHQLSTALGRESRDQVTEGEHHV